MMANNRKTCLPRGFIPIALLLTFAAQNDVTAKQGHNSKPMELSGFSLSEAFDISDDAPLNLDAPIVKQLLYRIKRTSPKTRRKYSHYSQDLTWQDINKRTEDFRFWLLDRPAQLKKIKEYRFPNAEIDDEIRGLYVCYCESISQNVLEEPGSDHQPFLAISRSVPKGLPLGVEIDEEINVEGFLYARVTDSSSNSNQVLPVVIADRIAWYPTRQSNDVSPAHLELSLHGFDIGLIDQVRENNMRPLDNRDAEAFFQVLAAVNRMEIEDQPLEASTTDSGTAVDKLVFSDLMQNSDTNFAQSATVTGTVRTCSKVTVPFEDIRNRLGVSQYYQLMLFPDLDGTEIIVKNQDGSKMGYSRFPITVCCTELPKGMSPADLERKQFVVDGYFYRFWKYQSDNTDGKSAGQVSPLIIAKRPQLVALSSGRLNQLLVILMMTIIAGILLLIGAYRLADRRRKTSSKALPDALPAQIDLTGLDE